MKMLEIEDIYAGYGDLKVLYGISLHVDQGEIVSLVGSNGAGKTTILRIISGFVPVTGGSIRFEGRDLLKAKSSERCGMGIAHIPQGRGTLAKMTVLENLYLGAYDKKAALKMQENIEISYEMFPKLKARQNQIAGSLSGGEQQMLAITRALMACPKMIIMDEPSLGLAPIIVEEMFEIIDRVSKERNVSILVVEQNLVKALSISSRGYVLENGKIVMEGPSKDLLENPEISKAYLGI